MAANDDIKYGIANTLAGVTVTASIVLPASPGVSWFITDVAFRLQANGAFAANVFIIDGVTTVFIEELYTTAANTPDELIRTVNIRGTPGNSMTIEFGGAAATSIEAMTVNFAIL
jgi:hypothetical protein